MGMLEIGPHDEVKKYYETPVNKRIKHWAIGVVLVVIALLILLFVLTDAISLLAIHLLRACIGLGAIIFVVLVAILIYRVNKAYIDSKDK